MHQGLAVADDAKSYWWRYDISGHRKTIRHTVCFCSIINKVTVRHQRSHGAGRADALLLLVFYAPD
jgi:hypothetical protein